MWDSVIIQCLQTGGRKLVFKGGAFLVIVTVFPLWLYVKIKQVRQNPVGEETETTYCIRDQVHVVRLSDTPCWFHPALPLSQYLYLLLLQHRRSPSSHSDCTLLSTVNGSKNISSESVTSQCAQQVLVESFVMLLFPTVPHVFIQTNRLCVCVCVTVCCWYNRYF